jgi:hypothetical protein
LRPYKRTSFHHQPEAQHLKFFSYPQAAGRLPHLFPRFPTYRCVASFGEAISPARDEARRIAADWAVSTRRQRKNVLVCAVSGGVA